VRVVFMGTPDYATHILKELLTCKEIEIPLLVTQPDKPAGRGRNLNQPHTKSFILKNSFKVDIYQPRTLKSIDSFEYINSFKPDFIIVAAYGQILPKEILSIAPCINLHASLLPKYRGASPIQLSLLNGDKFAGVTAILMEEGLDTGDMLGFSYFKLDEHIRVESLFEQLSFMAAKLTKKILENFYNLEPMEQKGSDTSYAGKIKKSDGLVSFSNDTASEIYSKFKAYSSWPGLFLESGLKLKDIEVAELHSSQKPNTIISINENVIVACKEGGLKLKFLQSPSKKEMSAVEYIRGKRLDIGNSMV